MNRKKMPGNYAFKLLLRDSMLMYQGTTLDSVLQTFYDRMRNGNAGAFNEIINLLSQQQSGDAIIVNSNITPENLSESNLTLFNEIYLATWGQNNFVIDSLSRAILEFIAYQNPFSGGPAVYSARVMLGLDLADFIPESPERKSEFTTNAILVDNGMIIPNPNSGKMQYIYSVNAVVKSIFQIFNVRGCLIHTYDLLPENNSLELDLIDQPCGIYIYRVIINGEIHPGNKIIIQK